MTLLGGNPFSQPAGGLKVSDFYKDIAIGDVPGYSMVHKFGAGSISTTLIPVTSAGVYRTPTAAVALEFVSSDINDDAVGTGAQQVTVVGLDSTWAEVEVTVETDGTTPVALGTSLLRVYRWYVSRSGTYATASAGSHAGTLTLRVAGAGDTWSTIGISPFPTGQSQIGCYTIPAGKTGYLLNKNIFVDSGKNADVYFFRRCDADDVTTPFTGNMRLFEREVGVQGGYALNNSAPKFLGAGPCDVGFMAKVTTTTAVVSVEFEILLIDN